MKKDLQTEHKPSKMAVFYRKFLNLLLQNRALVVVVVILIFASSIKVLQLVPKKFFPESSESTFTSEIRLPVGTAIETTKYSVSVIENYIKEKYMNFVFCLK